MTLPPPARSPDRAAGLAEAIRDAFAEQDEAERGHAAFHEPGLDLSEADHHHVPTPGTKREER